MRMWLLGSDQAIGSVTSGTREWMSVTVTNSALWFLFGAGLLVTMFSAFWAYGRRHRTDLV